jgi:hypothetical protein
MTRFFLRLLLGREMAENLLWIRENPDAVVDEEMAAWSWERAE